MRINLSVNLGRLKLKNPVMVASGTFGYGEEFADFVALKNLGALVTKTITLKPRQGNYPGRTCETPSGMLNSIGLENPGLEGFIQDKLPGLKKIGTPLIVSIASESDPQEFITLAGRLDKINAVSALELNISCPNLKHTKLISQDAKATYAAVKKARKATRKTLIVKLSPNVTDVAEIALAAQSAGADAISLINTLTGMAIDVKTRRPKITAVIGGLSGPAIRPVAVRMVWEVYRKIKIPIIGMGGIMDTASALEFLLAGASAVSVGTANFIDPGVTGEIISGLGKYLRTNRICSVSELTGALRCQP